MTTEIVLKDAFKGYTLDQDKTMPPEETVKRLKARLAQLDLDILAETARIDNGRLDIPVFFSRCGKDALEVIGNKKQMGKGGKPDQAEASAVMELAERFSLFAFHKNPDNFQVNTHRDVKGEALPFEQIAKSVHDDGDLDAKERVFADVPMRWLRAWNMTRERLELIPFDWFYKINEFNGSSAGNRVEEALSQGVCEVVERHVSSMVNHERRAVPAIRADSITDPVSVEMLRKYRDAGILVHLSDFTLDMGIPTVGVLAWDPVTFPEKSEIVWTAGTTPDPQKALSRALSETAQLAGDFNTGSNYVASGLPKFHDIEEAGFITRPGREIDITDLPNISHDNIRVEVENCLAALTARDMEVIVVDVTHPALGAPAFYTIIPGAHFRERSLGASVGMFSAKIASENMPPAAAVEALTRMDAILPEKYYIHFYLGTCRLALGDAGEALQSFRRALDLNPTAQDAPSIHSYMGVGLKEMGAYPEALDVLKKGLELDSERIDILNLMGFCHFKLKAHEKAIECFREVVRLDPSSAIDYANIASNYRELGKRDQAIKYYETALAMDPTITFARDSLDKLLKEVI